MPDFRMENKFPIATVIDAAQRKAELEQKFQNQNTELFNSSLAKIGTIGQSLYDQKKQIAQSLALGKQFDVDPELSRTLEPTQVLEAAKIKQHMTDSGLAIDAFRAQLGLPPMQRANTASPGATKTSQDSTTTTPQSQNGAMLTSNVTATPMPDAPLPPSTTGSMPVPISAPPTIPRAFPKQLNPAEMKLLQHVVDANKQVHVMTNEAGLNQGSVPKGTIFKEPVATNLNVGLKEDQFYQREWDKLLKESDPLNASSRTPLGLASRATFQANRAIKTLSNPVVTNQEAGNAMADIAAIYQNGSPTQFGMSHQQYQTLYGKAQGLIQTISGKPQDAVPDAIKNRLLGVLSDMKDTNNALLKQRLDMTEHSKKAVISRFPDEWKEYRQILEGDQDQYNGMAQTPTPIPQGSSWNQSKEQRYQELLMKKQKGSVNL